MAYDITDYDELQIYVTDGWREWYIPKFRIFMTVDGDFCNLYWTDTERGSSGLTRLLSLDYNDVTFGYLTPSSASEVVLQIDSYIISALGGGGGSSPDASTTVKGITKLSVAPVSATDPIAVGDNDPRLINQAYRSIVFNLYNGGYDLTTGIQDAPVIIPFAGTVTGWEIMAYDSTNTLISTSCVVDILSDTFANLPLSGTDSIAGSEKPTLSSASTNSDNTITTWSGLTLYNYVQAEIESINAGVARIVISIKVTV